MRETRPLRVIVLFYCSASFLTIGCGGSEEDHRTEAEPIGYGILPPIPGPDADLTGCNVWAQDFWMLNQLRKDAEEQYGADSPEARQAGALALAAVKSWRLCMERGQDPECPPGYSGQWVRNSDPTGSPFVWECVPDVPLPAPAPSDPAEDEPSLTPLPAPSDPSEIPLEIPEDWLIQPAEDEPSLAPVPAPDSSDALMETPEDWFAPAP